MVYSVSVSGFSVRLFGHRFTCPPLLARAHRQLETDRHTAPETDPETDRYRKTHNCWRRRRRRNSDRREVSAGFQQHRNDMAGPLNSSRSQGIDSNSRLKMKVGKGTYFDKFEIYCGQG